MTDQHVALTKQCRLVDPAHRVAFLESEIDAWMEMRIAERVGP